MDSYDILVIGLSVLLAVFLTLSIILIVMVINLIKKVNAISDKAQETAANVSHFTSKMGSAVSISALGASVVKFISSFKKERK